MVAPFLQFLAEECYSSLGNTNSIFDVSWPEVDESKLYNEVESSNNEKIEKTLRE